MLSYNLYLDVQGLSEEEETHLVEDLDKLLDKYGFTWFSDKTEREEWSAERVRVERKYLKKEAF